MVTARGRAGNPGAGQTIGVVAPLLGGFYFGSVIAGVTRAAARAGMRVVAVQTFPTRLARERHPSEPLPGEPAGLDAVDAVVVITDALEADRLRELLAGDRPVVLVSTDLPGADVPGSDASGAGVPVPDAPVLRPDNVGGARAAVDHLVEHGHTRIGFVGDLTQGDIRERHEGWRAALAAHGIAPGDDWFLTAPGNTVTGGADAAAAGLRGGPATTAVLAATDLVAIGYLRGLREAGVGHLRGRAVIGFDRTEGGARVSPRLATVDPHHDRVGELAVAHVLARLRGEPRPGLRVPATLVRRESCGCRVVGTGEGESSGADVLRRVATTAFAGPGGARGTRPAGDPAAAWADAVLALLRAAAERGTTPSPAALRRLRDLTAGLGPYPETLEECVTAVRLLEEEATGSLPDDLPDDVTEGRRRVLRAAVTDVLLALTRGCQRPMLAREAAMERTIAEQYEVDMDLAARGGARTLTWLPEAGRTSGCLGLWTGRATSDGGREIEIAGTLTRSGTLARSLGRRVPAARFPPQALLRQEPLDGSTLVFVVPVTSPERDWGLLAVTGRLDPRMLYSRERHQHWGALVALVLDEEARVARLAERLSSLEQVSAASAEVTAAQELANERHQAWLGVLEHALWDWDVARGTVHWSPRCAELFGVSPEHLTDSPSEWVGRVHPEDRVALSALLAAQLGGASGPLRIEHRVQHASGSYRWVLCDAVTVTDDAGVPARLLGALVDVTDRKERELALVAGELRDPGSGMPNRESVLDRLGTVLARVRRGAGDAAVAVLRVLPGAVADEGVGDEWAADEGAGDVTAALAAHLEAGARHGDVVGHLGVGLLGCVVVDLPEVTGAQRLTRILEDLPGPWRRRLAVGTVLSVLPYDDPAEVVRVAEAVAAREVPGVAR